MSELKTHTECKKCKHYLGMHKKFKSSIRCNRHDGLVALVLTMPSNEYHDTIPNGEPIVHCNK